MSDITQMPFEELRAVAIEVMRGAAHIVTSRRVGDTEKLRAEMRGYLEAGSSSWYDSYFYALTYYCAVMVDKGHGMGFSHVRDLNGNPKHQIDVAEDFYVDMKPVLLNSDQGKIIMVHGTPDGRIVVGLGPDKKPVIRPLAYLTRVVPKGRYFLSSCFNGCKDPRILTLLRSKGWEFILTNDSPAVTMMIIEPVNYTMVSYGLTKRDAEESFGPGSYYQ